MAGTRREQAMAGDKRGRQVPEIERGWLRGDDGLPAAIVAVTAEMERDQGDGWHWLDRNENRRQVEQKRVRGLNGDGVRHTTNGL